MAGPTAWICRISGRTKAGKEHTEQRVHQRFNARGTRRPDSTESNGSEESLIARNERSTHDHLYVTTQRSQSLVELFCVGFDAARHTGHPTDAEYHDSHKPA